MEKKLRLSIIGTLRFAVLFGATFTLWKFFHSYLFFLALVLMALCVPLSAWALWSHRDGLRAELMLADGPVGRKVPFSLGIRVFHSGRFAGFTADLTYRWSNRFTGFCARKKEHVWAGPAGGRTLKNELVSAYAGCVEVCAEEFVVYDFFRIFRLYGCDTVDADVLVWPGYGGEADPEELYNCVDGMPKASESRRRGVDYDPDYEVREYIPGDQLKNIHWKLSAKQKRMMVRERLASGCERMNVLLPLGDDRDENDGLMEALLSLCRMLLGKGYPILLYYPGKDDGLNACRIEEAGDIDRIAGQILSSSGLHQPGCVEERMAVEHSGENYILVQTGAYIGAYIRREES